MRNNNKDKSNSLWLYGKHSCFSAIENNRRKIFKILVTKNSQNLLDDFLTKNKFFTTKTLVKLVEVNQIESIVGKNQPHQGIAVECSKIPTKSQIDLLEELYTFDKNKLPNLLLLDQLSDPQNIGAIIRSAVSFGVKKIIFCEHNAPKENAAMAKSSAGTIEVVDLIVVTNFNNLMEKLKKIGYWCIGLEGKSNNLISEIHDYKTIALVIGSEGNGIRDLVKKNCDILAKIPIDEKVESLNASVAASIALYELSKKNK